MAALVGNDATASAWVARMVSDTGGVDAGTLPPKSEDEELRELNALFGRKHRATSSMQLHGFDLMNPPLNPAVCPLDAAAAGREDPITEKPWQPWAGNAYQQVVFRHVQRSKARARAAVPTSLDKDFRRSQVGLTTPREVLFQAVGELQVKRNLQTLANISGRRVRR